MNARQTWLRRPRQIPKRDTWSRLGNRLLMLHHETPPPARLAFLLLLLMLVLSLAGCATTSVPPDSLPRNPAPPPSVLPTSQPTYLEDARQAISEWRKLLQGLTAKPAP